VGGSEILAVPVSALSDFVWGEVGFPFPDIPWWGKPSSVQVVHLARLTPGSGQSADVL